MLPNDLLKFILFDLKSKETQLNPQFQWFGDKYDKIHHRKWKTTAITVEMKVVTDTISDKNLKKLFQWN